MGEKRIYNSINLIVEAVAISDGVQFCIDRGFIPLIMEIDSLAMLNILEERWDVPQSVVQEVEVVNRMREGVPIRLKHALREDNTLTNLFC